MAFMEAPVLNKAAFSAYLFEGGIEHGILQQTFHWWLPHHCGGFLVNCNLLPFLHTTSFQTQ